MSWKRHRVLSLEKFDSYAERYYLLATTTYAERIAEAQDSIRLAKLSCLPRIICFDIYLGIFQICYFYTVRAILPSYLPLMV